MFLLLSQYSRSRTAWLLLFLSGLLFEMIALYFQHSLGFAPCTLCIYQRCAIFGIMIASLIALCSPRNLVFRLIALLLWLYCAFRGLSLAIFNAHLQFEPNLTDTCSTNVEFPSWLSLDQWFPSIFNATGICSERVWSFLTIEMSQWMIIIFASYFIVGVAVLIAQLIVPRKNSLWAK
ncbi:disulfide bond formation protein DsbB [Orbaceae bacterium ESL0727]|nr:disulfide bond formation protein DsbB [Orbaceae bacterium ESL0727]